MKISTSDIPKMGLAALVTAVIFIIFLNLPRPMPTDPIPPKTLKSRISWDEAVKLRENYTKTKSILVDVTDDQGNEVKVPLEGFYMDPSALEEIIHHNQNPIGGNSKPERIIFFLGKNDKDNEIGKDIPLWTLIAAGVINKEVMKNSAATSNDIKSSVMDRADPCPPNCPK